MSFAEKIQRHSVIVVTVCTLLTAGLGVLSAYLGFKAANITQERDAVRGRATTLQTQQTDLQSQIVQLEADNADLRARLGGGSGSSTATAPDGTDVEHRPPLKVPLPADGGVEHILLDRGEVSAECCSGDLNYSRNDATGIPEIGSDVAISVDVASGAVTEEQCAQAVKTSPATPPLRRMREGMLICAITQGGTSLLRISSPPTRNGTLTFIQTFWPS
jgi:hypothetical protein